MCSTTQNKYFFILFLSLHIISINRVSDNSQYNDAVAISSVDTRTAEDKAFFSNTYQRAKELVKSHPKENKK